MTTEVYRRGCLLHIMLAIMVKKTMSCAGRHSLAREGVAIHLDLIQANAMYRLVSRRRGTRSWMGLGSLCRLQQTSIWNRLPHLSYKWVYKHMYTTPPSVHYSSSTTTSKPITSFHHHHLPHSPLRPLDNLRRLLPRKHDRRARMTRHRRRENASIRDPQPIDAVHAQLGVNSRLLCVRTHASRAHGVVDCLGSGADVRLELGVGHGVKVGLCAALGVGPVPALEVRGEGAGVDNVAREAEAVGHHVDVLCAGERAG